MADDRRRSWLRPIFRSSTIPPVHSITETLTPAVQKLIHVHRHSLQHLDLRLLDRPLLLRTCPHLESLRLQASLEHSLIVSRTLKRHAANLVDLVLVIDRPAMNWLHVQQVAELWEELRPLASLQSLSVSLRAPGRPMLPLSVLFSWTSRLSTLHVAGCTVQAGDKQLRWNNVTLKNLALVDCYLSSTILSFLPQLTGLESLALVACQGDALEQRRGWNQLPHLQSILCGGTLSSSGMLQALSKIPSLQRASLKMASADAVLIGEWLRRSTLLSLSLDHGDQMTPAALTALQQGLEANASLQQFRLTATGPLVGPLCAAVTGQAPLQDWELSGGSVVSAEDVARVGRLLETNRLERFALTDMNLSNDLVQAITKGLRSCTSLIELDLKGSVMDPNGWTLLGAALQDSNIQRLCVGQGVRIDNLCAFLQSLGHVHSLQSLALNVEIKTEEEANALLGLLQENQVITKMPDMPHLTDDLETARTAIMCCLKVNDFRRRALSAPRGCWPRLMSALGDDTDCLYTMVKSTLL